MSLNLKILLMLAPLTFVVDGRAQEIASAPPASSIETGIPAQTNEQEVSVELLIARALQNNPQLIIASANLDVARARAGAARAKRNPTLTMVPRLMGDREAAEAETIVSQPIDVFGKRRAEAQVFAAEASGAEAAALGARRTLVVQVKNAAVDLFAAQEAENLGAFQLEVATRFRDAAARRAELGDVPAVQVQRADLELLRVQNELTTARADRLVRRATLNQLMGQAPESPLRVALPLVAEVATALSINLTDSEIPAPIPPSSLGSSSQPDANLAARRSELLATASERPDITRAEFSVQALQAQVRAFGRQRLPDLELQVRRDTVFGTGSTALRAVVSLPLFDFGSLSREKKAAQAEVRASQAELALLRQQTATQVEQALIRLEQQRQTALLYRTAIVPQTLDLLRKTQIGYAQGASTYLEVLEAQRTLRGVQTEYLQALVGTRTSEAALESALGVAPPADLVGLSSNPIGPVAPPGTAPIGTIPERTAAPAAVAPLDPSSRNADSIIPPKEENR